MKISHTDGTIDKDREIPQTEFNKKPFPGLYLRIKLKAKKEIKAIRSKFIKKKKQNLPKKRNIMYRNN